MTWKTLLAVAVIVMSISCAKENEIDDSGREAKAKKLIEALASSDMATASADFTTEMKAGLPVEKLRAVWSTISSQGGAFRGISSTQAVGPTSLRTIVVRCRFANGDLEATVTFDGEEHVAGLHFRPPTS